MSERRGGGRYDGATRCAARRSRVRVTHTKRDIVSVSIARICVFTLIHLLRLREQRQQHQMLRHEAAG